MSVAISSRLLFIEYPNVCMRDCIEFDYVTRHQTQGTAAAAAGRKAECFYACVCDIHSF